MQSLSSSNPSAAVLVAFQHMSSAKEMDGTWN